MSSPRYRKSNLRKKALESGGSHELPRAPPNRASSHSVLSVTKGVNAERTVRKLRLSKALTVPDTTSVFEACQRMTVRRVDALLLTDSNALLCGILTDKDIATRVIAHELNLRETPVSKVMTRNPVIVLSDTLAVEALQKMIQGKFRHLPIVENGEVVALLQIAKCLYDAVARMERAAEKGKAIAVAVEGPNALNYALRERIFKPSLSTVISEHSKLITVSPTDTVFMTALKMNEFSLGCAVVTVENKPIGILTCKDILTRVIATDLPLDSTFVEKVMTPSPECATLDTPILDSLHIMHDGKFLHLPVIDMDGCVVAIVDVINVTHAAVSTLQADGKDDVSIEPLRALMHGLEDMFGTGESNNEAATSMMQRFLDSSMHLGPSIDDDEDTRSEDYFNPIHEGIEARRSFPSLHQPRTFAFKIEDRRGIMHRFVCDTHSLTDLITCILQRVGDYIDRKNPPLILYVDEDHDKVLLASDRDLVVAVDHAKAVGLKGLRLHLDYSGSRGQRRSPVAGTLCYTPEAHGRGAVYNAVAAGSVLVAGLGVYAFYVKRNG